MTIKAMLTGFGLGLGATAAVVAVNQHTKSADAGPPVVQVASTAASVADDSTPAPSPATPPTRDEPAVPAAPVITKVAASVLPDKKPDAPPAPEPGANAKQLDSLLAPIALYPDQLLQQILMASTYPLEVIEAARWSARPENEGLKGDALAAALEDMDWDPSVKALAAFPQILKMMDSDLDWLAHLGDAFLAQQADVMDSVQRLRREARAADQLNSDTRRQVVTEKDQIIIESANPQVVYVPFYDPAEAYGVWAYPDYPPVYIPPPLGFTYSPGIYYSFVSVDPFFSWSRWDWHNRRIRIVDPPRYAHYNHGRWPTDNDVWRHDPSRGHGLRGHDRDDDRNANWGGHRDQTYAGRPYPGTNPSRPYVPPPTNITTPNGPRPRAPGGPGPDVARDTDGMRMHTVAPRNRVYTPPSSGLPDLSPPLPAMATVPALAPVITNPNIGVHAPSQPSQDRIDNNHFGRYRQDEPPQQRSFTNVAPPVQPPIQPPIQQSAPVPTGLQPQYQPPPQIQQMPRVLPRAAQMAPPTVNTYIPPPQPVMQQPTVQPTVSAPQGATPDAVAPIAPRANRLGPPRP